MLCTMRDLAIALLIFAAFIVASGCAAAPEAPSSYSISSEFSPSERETIRAAVSAWCDAADACPEEVSRAADARFELVDDLPEIGMSACPAGRTCVVNGNERDGTVRIARNRVATGLDHLWRIAAHEFGHICIDGHRADSALMSGIEPEGPLLVIDNEAVTAWKDGCED